MKEKNVTARIGENFSRELEEIKKERVDRGIDKKKKSTRRLTNLMVKHKHFKKIKEDTIEINLEDTNEE